MSRSANRPDMNRSAHAPRQRILNAARELFYKSGIRAVGVDAIAEAASTNKMTLYRHFGSKDDLVAAYLEELAREGDERWVALEAAHPGNAAAQLAGWLAHVEDIVLNSGDRGCAIANAAVELREMNHPARRIIEGYKQRKRTRLLEMLRAAGYGDPELLADEVFLLFEGARISNQCCTDHGGPASRLMDMLRSLLARHPRRTRAK